MIHLFLLNVFLQVTVSIAYPGECTAKNMQMWIAKKRFKYNSVGGAEQILLDNFYLEYFLAETDELRKTLFLKIAIFTHIYLLQCKMEQNREQLEGIFIKKEGNPESTEKKKGNKIPSIYKQFSSELTDIIQSAWEKADELSLCHLLRLKFELFKQMRLKIFGHSMKRPNCKNSAVATQTIVENREQIAEWMLSDLLHFFPHRHRMIEYFRQVSTRNMNLQKFQQNMNDTTAIKTLS
uniref:IFN-gamma n=1 Tax=Globodera pallida TaxID=36090 RepID=A0A183BJR7_GLOPA